MKQVTSGFNRKTTKSPPRTRTPKLRDDIILDHVRVVLNMSKLFDLDYLYHVNAIYQLFNSTEYTPKAAAYAE